MHLQPRPYFGRRASKTWVIDVFSHVRICSYTRWRRNSIQDAAGWGKSRGSEMGVLQRLMRVDSVMDVVLCKGRAPSQKTQYSFSPRLLLSASTWKQPPCWNAIKLGYYYCQISGDIFCFKQTFLFVKSINYLHLRTQVAAFLNTSWDKTVSVLTTRTASQTHRKVDFNDFQRKGLALEFSSSKHQFCLWIKERVFLSASLNFVSPCDKTSTPSRRPNVVSSLSNYQLLWFSLV